MKKHFINAIKGFFVGASMSLPGISGGTMAIILNIYDRIIQSVNGFVSRKNFMENFKKNFLFLAEVGIAAVLGLGLLSKVFLYITELFPIPMHFLFMGAIVGSIPMLIKKTGITRITPKIVIGALGGLAFVFIMELIPELPSSLTDISDGLGVTEVLAFLLSGIFLAFALILPGISFSHMLVVMGIYDTFYGAIHTLNIPFLILIGGSLLIGIILLIKVLAFALEKFPDVTYAMIIGFVVGSIKDVYIGLPTSYMIPVSILTFAGGFALVFMLSMKNQDEN